MTPLDAPLVQFFAPASGPTAAGLPAAVLRAAESLASRWVAVPDALARLRRAARLDRVNDPRGDVYDVPPIASDLFGDAVPEGTIVYRKGDSVHGLRWILIRYRPGAVIQCSPHGPGGIDCHA